MSIVNYMRRRVYTNFDVNEDGDVKKVCVCVGGWLCASKCDCDGADDDDDIVQRFDHWNGNIMSYRRPGEHIYTLVLDSHEYTRKKYMASCVERNFYFLGCRNKMFIHCESFVTGYYRRRLQS